MKYKNAKNIIPKELLEQIQQYIQGDVIYIPTTKDRKIAWGQKNGTKEAIYNRNKDIFKLYISGHEINEIINIYNLSESSIRKIICKMKKEIKQYDNALGLGGLINE